MFKVGMIVQYIGETSGIGMHDFIKAGFYEVHKQYPGVYKDDRMTIINRNKTLGFPLITDIHCKQMDTPLYKVLNK